MNGKTLFIAIFINTISMSGFAGIGEEIYRSLDDAAWAAWNAGNKAHSRVYQRMRRISRSVRYVRNSRQNRENCHPGAQAFTYVGDPNKNIFLCPLFDTFSPGQQVHVAVHEIAHLAGYRDECLAERIAKDVMRWSRRSHYFSGLGPGC